MKIREYRESDLPEMVRIWNEIIEAGFRILQFNCVVEDNVAARKLYDKLGFRQIGTIEGGLQIKDGCYVNTCPYYIDMVK